MKIEDVKMGDILPQQPPFRFVDRMTSFSEVETFTAFTPTGATWFVEDGLFQAEGLVENMAQSCAARIGYICKYIKKIPVKPGYIGSIRNLIVERLPRAGETISTQVIHREEIFGITLSDVVVRSGEEILATATMKTAVPREDQI